MRLLHGIANETDERHDVGGGRAADVDDEVRVHVRHLCPADASPLQPGGLDESSGRIAFRVHEHASRAGHRKRLGALAASQACLHAAADEVGVALHQSKHGLDDDAARLQPARPIAPRRSRVRERQRAPPPARRASPTPRSSRSTPRDYRRSWPARRRRYPGCRRRTRGRCAPPRRRRARQRARMTPAPERKLIALERVALEVAARESAPHRRSHRRRRARCCPCRERASRRPPRRECSVAVARSATLAHSTSSAAGPPMR